MMKKYIELNNGEVLMEGDEWLVNAEQDRWEEVPLDLVGKKSWAIFTNLRRPIPHTGDVQFLMAISILVPVIVNCDGREQESIEAEAGELAYQKVLDNPRKYINYESIDWANCKVDEVQPEPKNPGKKALDYCNAQHNQGQCRN